MLRKQLIIVLSIILMLVGACNSEKVSAVTPISLNIASSDTLFVAGDIPVVYRAKTNKPLNNNVSVRFETYPEWLHAETDSIYGIPPDPVMDSSFIVITSDGSSADTLQVVITVIPNMVIFGDTRSGHEVHRAIVDRILGRHPVIVFHDGDLVKDGTRQSDWDKFNSIEGDLMAVTEFYPALGNHEHQSQLFFDNFDLPNNEQWYAVDKLNVHFIVLNSCVDLQPASDQYNWLVSDLETHSDSSGYTVVIFHHPLYSTGRHREDEMGLRKTLIPLFEQHGVDCVFSGHDHDYERSFCGGIYYIVTGGGGAPLRDQARSDPCSQLFLKSYHYCKLSALPDRLVVSVYSAEDSLIDRFAM